MYCAKCKLWWLILATSRRWQKGTDFNWVWKDRPAIEMASHESPDD